MLHKGFFSHYFKKNDRILDKCLFNLNEIKWINELSYLNLYLFFDRENDRYFIPRSDRGILPHLKEDGLWEQEILDQLRKRNLKGKKVLIVGSNFGYHVVKIAKMVGENGRVIALEPVRELITLSRLNASINLHHNVDYYENAASSEKSKMHIWASEDNVGDIRLFDFKESIKKNYNIEAVRVDEKLKEYEFEFALIDTQGWEKEVIEGMTGMLANKKFPMIIEFNLKFIEQRGQDALELLKFYEALGYRIKSINNKRLTKTQVIKIAQDNIDKEISLILDPIL